MEEVRRSLRPGGYRNAVTSNRPIVGLFYVLLRDHISPGEMEGLVCRMEIEAQENPLFQFSNDFLAAYAIELVERLDGATPEQALATAHGKIKEAQFR